MSGRVKLLVLYDAAETYVGTIEEHLRSFARYSSMEVQYATATGRAEAADLSLFDAVVIHYSVRVCVESHLSSAYATALARYDGTKILFIQDEYDATEAARRAIEALGVSIVFTCVPLEQLQLVYPRERFGQVRFFSTLTGYVPVELERMVPRFGDPRPNLIGYRGRNLPYWYGDLGQEKVAIGRRMKEICIARGLPVDIEWDEHHRIYGDAWYDFIRSCTATLGSESGSNVFDEHGALRRGIEAALRDDPTATYESIRSRFIAAHEGKVRMNQVSPRIFEAVACGSALVLFEGEYSGVVRPDEHFIPLRKDFANVDDVLRRLQDRHHVETLTRRAYEHVIASRRYSYQAFVEEFDRCVAPLIVSRSSKALPPAVDAAGARVRGIQGPFAPVADQPLRTSQWKRLHRVRRGPLLSLVDMCSEAAGACMVAAWRSLPERGRAGFRSIGAAKIRRLFKEIR